MTNKFKKVLSLVVAVMLIAGMLPISALAANGETEVLEITGVTESNPLYEGAIAEADLDESDGDFEVQPAEEETECLHEYEAVVTAPTCTEEGFTTYTCILCGETYDGDYVAMTAHKYGADDICTDCGVKKGGEEEGGWDEAEEGIGEGLSWSFKKGVLTISGNGAMIDFTNGTPWDVYAADIKSVVIAEGVTAIGANAFYQSEMTEVSIPNSVTAIGENAFNGCEYLTAVTLNGVVTIGKAAFSDCVKLTTLTLGGNVTTIGASAFAGCSALTAVTLPDSVKTIGANAFRYCQALTSINIPNGVTVIDEYTFMGCDALTNITIPASVTSIGLSAFGACSGLTEIVFEGNAPQNDGIVFYGVTATATHPANATWTDAVKKSYGGTITWEDIKVENVLTITSQPENYVGIVGDMAAFTVEAEGDGLTYQWQFSKDSGATWEKASSTTNSISVEFKAYRVTYQYRCVITDAEGNSVITDVVKLVPADVELEITTQPVSYVGAVNDDVTFTVEATGNGLTYEWFFSTDGGKTWEKSYSPGYATNTLAPVLRSHRDCNMYKCVVTDVLGNSVESDVVSMTVKSSEIIITAQPQKVENAIFEELYQFTVEATGENLTYRWQFSTDDGETWEDSWNQGYNTATLSVRMYANRDGNLYRCAITSGLKETVYTDAVVLDMQDPSVELISQSVSLFVTVNQTATFTVEAEGMDLTYQWYRSNDKGATWKLTYLSGYDTDTLSFVAIADRAAMYMCKITDGSGKVIWSEPVTLTVLSAKLAIVNQPTNVTCANNDTATFTVEAQGDGLKYQWYYSDDDGETWTASYLSGYNTDTLSFVVTATRAAKIYKCVITDASGNTVATNAVSVTIG